MAAAPENGLEISHDLPNSEFNASLNITGSAIHNASDYEKILIEQIAHDVIGTIAFILESRESLRATGTSVEAKLGELRVQTQPFVYKLGAELRSAKQGIS